MTAPQPDDPPLTGAVCAAWAQMHELPNDVQQLHTNETWCSILALASDILWSASGRQWRNVSAIETVTLDQPEGACATGYGYAYQYGYWVPMGYTPSGSLRVRLPRPDVTAITAVEIAGSAFSAYRRAGNYAVRTDGKPWPMVNTTLITYQFGRLRPKSASLPTIELASELGKALARKPCNLPARVTSVTRQGISFDMLESLEVLREGLTGLYAVDQWIQSVNRPRRPRVGQVYSPDTVEARKA